MEILGVSPSVSTEKTIKKSNVVKAKGNVSTSLPSDVRELVDKISEIMPLLGGRAILPFITAETVSISDNMIILNYTKDSFEFKLLSTPENIAIIKQALYKATGMEYGIRFSDSVAEPKNELELDDAFSEILTDANDILYEE